MFYYFFFWKCFTVASFSVLISFVIPWFVFLVKGGQVVPRSVFLLPFFFCSAFLGDLWPGFGSGSERLFSCRRCFSIDLHFVNVLTSTPPHSLGPKLKRLSPSKHRRQTPIFDDKFWFSTPIFQNKLPLSNSDFRKQTSIFQNILWLVSNSHFGKQTPFSENKLPFFKANVDFPIQFFENKLRFSTKQTPIF